MEILIHSGKLFNGLNNPPIENAGLFIKDGIIRKVGKDSDLPFNKNISKVDASGSTIIPGLINCHTHITRRHLHKKGVNIPFRFGAKDIENLPDTQRICWAISNSWYELFQGITAFRDAGSKKRVSLELKKVFENEIVKGPKVLSSGVGIAMTGGHGTHGAGTARQADGVHEVRKAVREEMKAGADWIKLMASGGLGGMPDNEDPRWLEYSLDELRAGVEEAHKRQRKVMTHCGGVLSIKNSVLAGVDSIEHGMFLDETTANLMLENGVHYVPTVSGIKAVYQKEKDAGNNEFANFLYKEVILPHESSVQIAYNMGIKIATGTDTLGTIVDEIKIFNKLGFTKIEALCAATSIAAETIGLIDTVGTLEEGKDADLIIVEGGDLFEDFDLLKGEIQVYKKGNLVTNEWLVNLIP